MHAWHRLFVPETSIFRSTSVMVFVKIVFDTSLLDGSESINQSVVINGFYMSGIKYKIDN